MADYCTWGVYNGRNWDRLMTILHLSIVGCLVCDNLRSWRIMFSLLESWPWLGGGIFNWLPTIGKKNAHSHLVDWKIIEKKSVQSCCLLSFVLCILMCGNMNAFEFGKNEYGIGHTSSLSTHSFLYYLFPSMNQLVMLCISLLVHMSVVGFGNDQRLNWA